MHVPQPTPQNPRRIIWPVLGTTSRGVRHQRTPRLVAGARLAPAPDRLALFEESGDALLGVLRAGSYGNHLAEVAERLEIFHVAHLVKGFLPELEDGAAFGG